ncbi:hypothetical protein A2773_06210 [Candidatus Gottesmanbacteria bacterium RIFCSPHIGHO2_01_FULL_39_10]|uniref:Uncharacterized protein n=1 Tax=Candidatus Gottesmanbacteria bacterium RIFCSPHIGHO2_01_FULL_39_10 TaxID=1798375 RepID=A0A1F5ZMD2_9BACT|nr:MAG: hypothetical protein A2773_06210 [Candidatus Gottesmanbacteria bacterium RIFCSPHIGHO2_01_FULL_39_10]
MNYRPKPIKPFKTLEEEAEFWDTHDTSPLFDNPKTPILSLPLIESKKEAMMAIRLPKSSKEDMKRIARTYGLNISTLARMWLIEKLYAYINSRKESGKSKKNKLPQISPL